MKRKPPEDEGGAGHIVVDWDVETHRVGGCVEVGVLGRGELFRVGGCC